MSSYASGPKVGVPIVVSCKAALASRLWRRASSTVTSSTVRGVAASLAYFDTDISAGGIPDESPMAMRCVMLCKAAFRPGWLS